MVKVSTDGDKIQADNRFIAIISVREELPVALVDGNPGLRPLDGDTSFLQLALRPHAESKSQLKDLVTTSSVEYRRLNDRLLQDSKVCVLANVPQISSGMLQRLKEFVKLGGGLLIFAGDAIEVDWYNQQLFDNGDGLLPMPIDSLQGRSIPGSARPSATVANQFFEHPALAFFNEPQNGGTSRAKFHRWLHLKLTDEYSAAARASVESNSHVLARLSTGAPWMVEKPFGRGRVIMVATTADSDWGNLPALPAYVPLIQRLTVYLASSVTPPNNLNPGEPLVSLHPQHHIHRNARLVDAKGTEHQIKIAGEGRRGRIEFSKTLEPGVYRVTDPDGQIENFAVNLSRQESEPELLAMDKLEELGQSVNAVVINGASDYAKLDRQRRFGTGMWKPILWILLAFLFLEILFQQWITNRRLT